MEINVADLKFEVGFLCSTTCFQAVLRYALARFKNSCLLRRLRTLKTFKQETET